VKPAAQRKKNVRKKRQKIAHAVFRTNNEWVVGLPCYKENTVVEKKGGPAKGLTKKKRTSAMGGTTDKWKFGQQQ